MQDICHVGELSSINAHCLIEISAVLKIQQMWLGSWSVSVKEKKQHTTFFKAKKEWKTEMFD